MRKLIFTWGNKLDSRKMKTISVSMIVVLFAMFYSGFLFLVNALHTEKANSIHEISYTEEELAKMVYTAKTSPLVIDYSLFENMQHSPTLIAENTQFVNKIDAGDYMQWTNQLLGDAFLIDTVSLEDGCVAFIAYSEKTCCIRIIAINNSEELHSFKLNILDTEYESAIVNTYCIEATPEESISSHSYAQSISYVFDDESSSITSPLSSSTTALASSSSVLDENWEQASHPSSQNNSAENTAESIAESNSLSSSVTQEETPHSKLFSPDIPTAALIQPILTNTLRFSSIASNSDFDEQNTTNTVPSNTTPAIGFILDETASYDDVNKDNIEAVLHSKEIGEFVFFNVAIPPYVAELEDTILRSNIGNGSAIRIYSCGDIPAGYKTAPNTKGRNYFSYKATETTSDTGNQFFYFDYKTAFILESNTQGNSQEKVTIELRNNKPVTVKAFDFAKVLHCKENIKPEERSTVIFDTISQPTQQYPFAATVTAHNIDGFLSSWLNQASPFYYKSGNMLTHSTTYAALQASQNIIMKGNGTLNLIGGVAPANHSSNRSYALTANGKHPNIQLSLTLLDGFTLHSKGELGGIGDTNNHNSAHIGVSDIYVQNHSTLLCEGLLKTATAGIRAYREISADSQSLIMGQFAKIGLEAPFITCLNTKSNLPAANYSFANANSILDTSKTRIVGVGEITGIQSLPRFYTSESLFTVNSCLYGEENTLIYGEGKQTGIYFNNIGNIAIDELKQPNPFTLRNEISNSSVSTNKATIIAKGCERNSTGLKGVATETQDVTLISPSYGRVIAIGGHYGIFIDSKNKPMHLLANNFTELIAAGTSTHSFGIKTNGTGAGSIAIRNSRVYAIGSHSGIACSNEEVEFTIAGNLPNSKQEVFAFGGIPNEFLTNQDIVYHLTEMENFSFSDLPIPCLQNNGLLQASSSLSQNTSGISLSAGAQLRIEHPGTQVTAFGGVSGIKTCQKISGQKAPKGLLLVQDSAKLITHGGQYGFYLTDTPLQIFTQENNSTITTVEGYGKKAGIYSEEYIHTNTAPLLTGENHVYVYGYGEDCGIYTSQLLAQKGTTIVAETILDANEKDAAKPASFPAIKLVSPTSEIYPLLPEEQAVPRFPYNPKRQIEIENMSTLVEVYNVVNSPAFSFQKSYDLTQLPAFKQNIGHHSNLQTGRFIWTTPANPPLSNFPTQYSFIQYDAKDNLGYLQTVPANKQYNAGLLAAKPNSANKTIIGNLKNIDLHYSEVVSNLQTGKNGSITISPEEYNALVNDVNKHPKIHGSGTYRAVLRNHKNSSQTIAEQSINVTVELWQNNSGTISKIDSPPPNNLTFELTCLLNSYTPKQTAIIDTSQIKDNTIFLTKLLPGSYTLSPLTQWGTPYDDLPSISFSILSKEENGNNLLYLSLPDDSSQAKFTSIVHSSLPLSPEQGGGIPTFPEQAQTPAINAEFESKLRLFYPIEKENILNICVRAQGLFHGHNTPSFVIKVTGISGEAKNAVYYDYVSIPATSSMYEFKTRVLEKEITFSKIPNGTYSISAYPSLRTLPIAELNQQVTIKSGTVFNTVNNTLYFDFINAREGWNSSDKKTKNLNIELSYIYFSGEYADKNSFSVS